MRKYKQHTMEVRRKMKKVILFVIPVMLLLLTACGRTSPAAELSQSGESAGMANPWREITEAEAKELCPKSFSVPEGAENVVWSAMDPAADPSGTTGALVQLSFDLYGMRFTAREQLTGDKEVDQSGMYYDWTYQMEETLKNWADGNMPCHSFRFVGDEGYADLCTWYDAEAGVSYSLSVTAKDLDGFDLLAIAEALHG